jgi:hypothetical protein
MDLGDGSGPGADGGSCRRGERKAREFSKPWFNGDGRWEMMVVMASDFSWSLTQNPCKASLRLTDIEIFCSTRS